MNSNKIINTFSVMLILGFVVGLIHSITVIQNRLHTMHSWVTYTLKYFNTWVVISLFLVIGLLLIKKLWNLLFKKTPSSNIKDKIQRYGSILLSCIVGCLFFFWGGWSINHYLLPAKFHPLSLLADVGILLFSIFLGRITMNSIRDNKYKDLIFICYKSIALVLALFLIGLNSYVFVHSNKKPERPNILFILIDALRADHLSSYGYPRNTSPYIDSIAREGVIFSNTISSAPWTVPAIASMFTSVYPSVHRVLRNSAALGVLSNDFTTLAERLTENEYETAGIMSNPWLNGGYKINQGFKTYEMVEWNNAYELTSKALGWLDKRPSNPYFLFRLNNRPSTPFFLYLHYMDVHGPYDKIPSPYSEFYLENKDAIFNRELTEEEIKKIPAYWGLGDRQKKNLNYYVTLYDQEIRLVDAEIKKLMDKLDSMGLLNNTLVVITSDHGVEFLEHGDWDIGRNLHDENLHIPLIMKFPSKLPRNHIIDNQVRSIDIMPTLLGLLNIPVHSNISGEDLTPLIFQKRQFKLDALSEAGERDVYNYIKSLRTDRFKIIYDTKKKLVKFYDLEVDPKESVNIARKKEYSNQLKGIYDLLNTNIETNSYLRKQYKENQIRKLSEEMQDQLRSLGYIE